MATPLLPVNNGIATLSHVSYIVSDLERSLAFYAALGFSEVIPRVERAGEGTKVFLGPPGADVFGAQFELLRPEDGQRPPLGAAHRHVALRSADFDGTLERLEAIGIRPHAAPIRVREGSPRICTVDDPDGYGIELIEAER